MTPSQHTVLVFLVRGPPRQAGPPPLGQLPGAQRTTLFPEQPRPHCPDHFSPPASCLVVWLCVWWGPDRTEWQAPGVKTPIWLQSQLSGRSQRGVDPRSCRRSGQDHFSVGKVA